MGGISQTVLTQGDPLVGFRGKLSTSNSLIFSEAAGSTIQIGDQFNVSSLTMASFPAFGTSAFTIEYWVRFSSIDFLNTVVHQNGQAIIGSASVTGGLVVLHTANALYLQNYLVVNNNITIPTSAIPSQTWEIDTWYHIAISKNSTNQVTAWVNGYRTPAGITNNTNNYYIPPTIVASWRNTYGVGATNNLVGKLYNLKVTQGTTIYNVSSSTISIPTVSLNPDINTRLLLKSPTGNTTLDASGTTTITPRAGVVTQTLNTPFNDLTNLYNAKYNLSSPFSGQVSGSILFRGGNNNYATYNGSAGLAFGTGDFTIEWFAYSTDTYDNSIHWWYGDSASPTMGILFEVISGTSNIKFYFGAASFILLTTIPKTTYNKKWTHFAIVRISGVLFLYIDGLVQNGVGTAHTQNYSDTSSIFYFGKKGASASNIESFKGYITNFRVVKGLGVYTGTYTVPTSNLQRTSFANPFGGTNTVAIRSSQVPYLLVP